MENFWVRCTRAGCVIAPVRVYSQYDESGNINDSNFSGISFVVFSFDNEVVGPAYYVMIEEGQTGVQFLYDTPEHALRAYENCMLESD